MSGTKLAPTRLSFNRAEKHVEAIRGNLGSHKRMEGKTSDLFNVWVEITDAMCNDNQVLFGRTLASTWIIIYDYRVKKGK